MTSTAQMPGLSWAELMLYFYAYSLNQRLPASLQVPHPETLSSEDLAAFCQQVSQALKCYLEEEYPKQVKQDAYNAAWFGLTYTLRALYTPAHLMQLCKEAAQEFEALRQQFNF